jgi:queuosine precursor transporter
VTSNSQSARWWPGVLALLAYAVTIVAANWVTTRWPDVRLLTLHVPGGSFFAGLAFTWRNVLQDVWGRCAVLIAIGAGTGLTWLVASPQIARASLLAFAASELAAFAVYTALNRRSWHVAVLATNSVGVLVDSLVFVPLAFGAWTAVPGQLVGKTTTTLAALAVLMLARRQRPSRAAP